MGRNIFLGGFFCTLFFAAYSAFSYTCSKDCKSQCTKKILGATNFDPICFAGCKPWQAATCYDLSDPYVSAMGEIGKNAYPMAAGLMKSKNMHLTALAALQHLTDGEKAILRKYFGDLVNSVRIIFSAQLMNSWGPPSKEVHLGNFAGQTYGQDIYISLPRTNSSYMTSLIGHEMCHTLQYKNRGSSLHNFGRDYFEGYAKTGSYATNHMEKECKAIEIQIAADISTSSSISSRIPRGPIIFRDRI